jgi:SAM-dependent methyltransferase
VTAFSLGQLQDCAALLTDTADILAGRSTGAAVPDWCVVRGWDAYLEALDEDALHAAEHGGVLPAKGMPASLGEHLQRVAHVCRLPALVDAAGPGPNLRRAGPHKRVQVGAFVTACQQRLAPPARVVDVGSGHGHLTRALSAAWNTAGMGLDWNAQHVGTAQRLSVQAEDGVAFVEANALAGLPSAQPGDLWVGLHACGALGDVLVQHAVAWLAPLALVGCCPQKTHGTFRAPFLASAPRLSRAVLGLANVTPRSTGVEVDVEVDLGARTVREAVLNLLRQRDSTLQPGEEMRGVNRRVPRRGVLAHAAAAFAHRGWAPPAQEDAEAAMHRAGLRQARARRLAVPRVVLGRALEAFVALDRAWALHRAGLDVHVGTFVEASCTPRNIMVVAHPGRS